MTDETDRPEAGPGLTLDVDLDAPPEKVWRALTIPAFREQWLPAADLADPTPLEADPGSVRYRMRDPAPPHTESVVTFQVGPGDEGGTRLTIVHGRTPPRMAANTNRACRARAA